VNAAPEALGRLKALMRAPHRPPSVRAPYAPREAGPKPRFVAPPWLRSPDLSLDQLLSYDHILLAFSGGKDSLFCLLYLLAIGVPAERIELWHHLVDGDEGSTLMDWPSTSAYCAAIADAFGVPLYRSWHVGGFEGEMLRENERTAGACFETPDGAVECAGGTHGKLGTRRMFPQAGADLETRWCSSRLKVDVMDAALRNQPRFEWHRTLVVTGERAEESANRRHYATFEPHRADLRHGRTPRHVDHWRPAHRMTEREVWDLIGYFRVNVHPAYRLGFSRVSCATCIFGNEHQWATLRAIMRERVLAIAAYEAEFGKTISRKKERETGRYLTVLDMADRGTPYAMHPEDIRAALSTTFDEPVFLAHWTLPAGAYRRTPGPS
jgi:3'-phosphoadenosine 5'-phosphosulfate sulfotransferase (PAPS reductase)/FAD synthetase